jgi:hypothetical protein
MLLYDPAERILKWGRQRQTYSGQPATSGLGRAVLSLSHTVVLFIGK